MRNKLLAILIIGLIYNCLPRRTSMIVSDSYDKEKNLTTLTLLPHGNIEMPGEWTKTRYNSVSKQHFFENNDSTSIAVAKNLQDIYPIYSKGNTNKEFLRKFYKWERDYFQSKGCNISEIKSSEDYIIWDAKKNNTHTVFLFGTKEKFVFNFSIFIGSDLSEQEKIEFLESLFINN